MAALLGLALAGGNSRRMGQDKALLQPLGRANFLANAFDQLAKILPDCAISCAKERQYPGFPCICDIYEHCGPAGGVHAGLCYAQKRGLGGVLALACDLPLLNSAILKPLLNAQPGLDKYCVVYRNAQTGICEMLAGVYFTNFLPALEAGLEAGEKSLFQLTCPDHRFEIEYQHDQEEYFLNCNRPADLELLRSLKSAIV